MLVTKRAARHLAVIAVYMIIFWWAFDHLPAIVPRKAHEYLDEYGLDPLDYIAQYELEIPKIELDYHRPRFNQSKVALLIENRPLPNLAPLMLHMMSVVPPDWRFRFMGSNESVKFVNDSAAVRQKVMDGKLDLTYIPTNMSVAGQEMISRFLTDLWIYDTVLQPAEWLLIYQTDSVLCANSMDSLDNYLHYDWVGAPWWQGSRYGGNGGLSLRKVSSIIRVLQNQKRMNNSEPEDVWLTERLGHLPDTQTANGTESFKFSAEMSWVDEPMGYHIGTSGAILNGGVWGSQEKRTKIWNYCPELKLALDMDVEAFMGEKFCRQNW